MTGLCVGALSSAGLVAGCSSDAPRVKLDGSSTVFPISEAVAEEFRAVRPDVRVTIGQSGTGGGFKKFCNGEIDICNASRGIKPLEVEACAAADIQYTELSVAFDGIAILVNPANDWCDSLTVAQLASIWRPDEPAVKWSDVNPSWPDKPINLYGPGTDSGTFDYFTEVIVGEEKACRPDFTASEDDNVLVSGIKEDHYALGYFGYAFYVENKESLKLVGIEPEGGKPVFPSVETIRTNEYAPLSRPLFVYVRNQALRRPEGREFVKFYLDQAAAMSSDVGYVAVSDAVEKANTAAFAKATSAALAEDNPVETKSASVAEPAAPR
ncbi:MAG: PstS family phosphate ABC transporter substrate-binding protein [Lacipirellulaceae bacterium]